MIVDDAVKCARALSGVLCSCIEAGDGRNVATYCCEVRRKELDDYWISAAEKCIIVSGRNIEAVLQEKVSNAAKHCSLLRCYRYRPR